MEATRRGVVAFLQNTFEFRPFPTFVLLQDQRCHHTCSRFKTSLSSLFSLLKHFKTFFSQHCIIEGYQTLVIHIES